MPGPITSAWCFQMLQSKEQYIESRPAFISTRRQEEVPKHSRSRSTKLLSMLATQIQSQRCLSDLFRIPHCEVHAHGFAEELLICIRDLSLLSSRRHVRRGVHAKRILRAREEKWCLRPCMTSSARARDEKS